MSPAAWGCWLVRIHITTTGACLEAVGSVRIHTGCETERSEGRFRALMSSWCESGRFARPSEVMGTREPWEARLPCRCWTGNARPRTSPERYGWTGFMAVNEPTHSGPISGRLAYDPPEVLARSAWLVAHARTTSAPSAVKRAASCGFRWKVPMHRSCCQMLTTRTCASWCHVMRSERPRASANHSRRGAGSATISPTAAASSRAGRASRLSR